MKKVFRDISNKNYYSLNVKSNDKNNKAFKNKIKMMKMQTYKIRKISERETLSSDRVQTNVRDIQNNLNSIKSIFDEEIDHESYIRDYM